METGTVSLFQTKIIFSTGTSTGTVLLIPVYKNTSKNGTKTFSKSFYTGSDAVSETMSSIIFLNVPPIF